MMQMPNESLCWQPHVHSPLVRRETGTYGCNLGALPDRWSVFVGTCWLRLLRGHSRLSLQKKWRGKPDRLVTSTSSAADTSSLHHHAATSSPTGYPPCALLRITCRCRFWVRCTIVESCCEGGRRESCALRHALSRHPHRARKLESVMPTMTSRRQSEAGGLYHHQVVCRRVCAYLLPPSCGFLLRQLKNLMGT